MPPRPTLPRVSRVDTVWCSAPALPAPSRRAPDSAAAPTDTSASASLAAAPDSAARARGRRAGSRAGRGGRQRCTQDRRAARWFERADRWRAGERGGNPACRRAVTRWASRRRCTTSTKRRCRSSPAISMNWSRCWCGRASRRRAGRSSQRRLAARGVVPAGCAKPGPTYNADRSCYDVRPRPIDAANVILTPDIKGMPSPEHPAGQGVGRRASARSAGLAALQRPEVRVPRPAVRRQHLVGAGDAGWRGGRRMDDLGVRRRYASRTVNGER